MSYLTKCQPTLQKSKNVQKSLFDPPKGHYFRKSKNQTCFLDISNPLNTNSTKSKESEIVRTFRISGTDILHFLFYASYVNASNSASAPNNTLKTILLIPHQTCCNTISSSPTFRISKLFTSSLT